MVRGANFLPQGGGAPVTLQGWGAQLGGKAFCPAPYSERVEGCSGSGTLVRKALKSLDLSFHPLLWFSFPFSVKFLRGK